MWMIEFYGTDQSCGEIRTHFIDFSNDLPGGVTVSSATAALTAFPAGGTASLSVGVISANVVPVTVTSPTLAGQYYIDVTATLSDAEKSVARLIVNVSWESARTTMAELVRELRGMTNAGVNDYTVGGERFWSDRKLQNALDQRRVYQNGLGLNAVPTYANGSSTYTYYQAGVGGWEGSPVVQDANGGTVGTALYSFNAQLGELTFTADQGGAPYTLRGYTYDLNAAAADVWRTKAAHFAGAYDVSTDNHTLKRSQLIAQAQQMAAMYASMGSNNVVDAERGDM
jgi:hypothetical protein